jgi:hypothetical protein
VRHDFPDAASPRKSRLSRNAGTTKFSSAELASFLSIVRSLPKRKSPPIPSIVPAVTQWSRNRTLPVNELVREEKKSRVERESIDWLAAHCPQSRFVIRALRRENK